MRIQAQCDAYALRLGMADQSGEYTPSWVWPGANQEPDLFLHPREVKMYARRYNTYSPKTRSNLINDIDKNGMRTPITLQTNGTHAAIADGHHRMMAANALGLDRVPVWVEHDPDVYGGKRVGPGLGEWLDKGGTPREPGWYLDPGEGEHRQ